VHYENAKTIAILKLQTPKYHFSELLIIVVEKRILAQRISPLQIVHYENAQPIAILKLHPTKNTIFGIVDYCIAATHFAAIFLHKYIFLTFNV
jgi:hypothetical protein